MLSMSRSLRKAWELDDIKIVGVDIFLEKRKTRMYVGRLEQRQGQFVFTYNERYFRAKQIIPLGPEFPLIQRQFQSKELFPSLEDRIPSRENPAYPEYCHMMGIDPQESDPMVLLSTIGKKGSSSFIFYPVFERAVSGKDVVQFRQSLGLTTREFARVFEISLSSLSSVEIKQALGKDLLKRLEIIMRFPQVALYLLKLNGGILSHDRWVYAFEKLSKSSMP